jgi:hypothetical protein
MDCLTDVRVFLLQDPLAPIDEGNSAAEASHSLCKFQPNITSSKNHEMIWNNAQLECFNVG